MSIHPGYAEAILSGRKRAEFRKRLAEDVRTVLSTAHFTSKRDRWLVHRHPGTLKAAPGRYLAPTALSWRNLLHDFTNYYSGRSLGVALLVGEVGRLTRPVPLSGVDPSPV